MGKKIVVIGSSNVDLIMKMDHLPAVGETVTDAEFFQVYGGKGANQAVAAARAGGEVAFVNCVGSDAYTPRMLENFRNDGIDTSYVFHDESRSSGHALVMIGQAGQNYLSVAPGANYSLTPELVEQARPIIDEAAIIIMQNEIKDVTIQYVLALAEEKGIPVLWNFAPAREFDLKYLGKATLLVVNEIEARFLTGIEVADGTSTGNAARKLLKEGISMVIITLGEEGAIAFRDHHVYKVPGYHVESVDTTSAGDVFCGSLAVALQEGNPVEEALQFANAAAAICVSRVGAQPSAPKRTEIEEFLKSRNR